MLVHTRSRTGAGWSNPSGGNRGSKPASRSDRTRFGLVTLLKVASLPKMMKPVIGGEATSKLHLPNLPGWLGTARRDRSVEEPGRPGRVEKRELPLNGPRESITEEASPGRESERPIVVKKRGNARGAKGSYWKHCCCKKKGDPLEGNFHYGNR